MSRVFLTVLDSVGIGEMPDANLFGDEGSNTLKAASVSSCFSMPNMDQLGLFHIDGVSIDGYPKNAAFSATVARMKEESMGKDTTIGHWEIAGLISKEPLPVFPEGFPNELLDQIIKLSGRGLLCNRPYSGTKVIEDYGEESIRTGALIIYTSADSVLQIAAHEEVVPLQELYEICQKVRRICVGKYGVGRIIARPFLGKPGAFYRTSGRHDYSLCPPAKTVLDAIKEAGKDVIAVGKISDIFAGQGITEMVRTVSNADGIVKTREYLQKDFDGLCFINLVDYDMLYGHRNDVEGYAKALTEYDQALPGLLALLREDDVFMITADHGCDPSTPSTDHSREYTPFLMIKKQSTGINLGTRKSFADIAATIADILKINYSCSGISMM